MLGEVPSAKRFRRVTRLQAASAKERLYLAALTQAAKFLRLFHGLLDEFGKEGNWIRRVEHAGKCAVRTPPSSSAESFNPVCDCTPLIELIWANPTIDPVKDVNEVNAQWEKQNGPDLARGFRQTPPGSDKPLQDAPGSMISG